MTDEDTASEPPDGNRAPLERSTDRSRPKRSESESIQHTLRTLESLGVSLEYCNGDVGLFRFPAENGTISLSAGDPRVCKAAYALLQNHLGEIIPRRIVQEALDLIQGKQILKATTEQLSTLPELSPVQNAVLGFMEGKPSWSGATGNLRKELINNRKTYRFPQIGTQSLSRCLNSARKQLQQFGLVVELGRRGYGSHVELAWIDASDASDAFDANDELFQFIDPSCISNIEEIN